MTSKGTDVYLTVTTFSVADGQTDSTSFKYNGTLYCKGDSTYITYTDGETCSIRQKGDVLRTVRHKSGTGMTFEVDKTHTATVATPVGVMPLEVVTHSLSGDIQTELELTYDLIYSGTVMTQNTVNIKIEEK